MGNNTHITLLIIIKLKKISAFAICLLSISICSAQSFNKTILVDGLNRSYIIHLPPAFINGQKLPVIFALHGGGGTAQGAVSFYNLEPLADKNNFIIVYPDAINKAWNIPGITSRVKRLDTMVNDVHFISALLDTLIANYKAGDKKIYCTGISRGAMFSFYLADALNSRITAIAPVCGGISKTLSATYSFKKPIPVLMINGTDDPLVSYNGGYGKMNGRNEGNEDGDMLPTVDLVKKIVMFDNCSATSKTYSLPDNDKYDGCTEIESVYDCSNVKVDFIKIENGGHTWPGGTQYLPKFLIGKLCKDFSASQKIFDFFINNSK